MTLRSRMTLAGLVLAIAAAGSTLALGESRDKGAAKTAEQQATYRLKQQTAKAQAAYNAALQKCGALAKTAQKACREEAKITRDAAIRQARIEKAQKMAELKEPTKPPKTPAELYTAEKARCEMLGLERERCLTDLKQRFHKG